jgi:hypothetical protein
MSIRSAMAFLCLAGVAALGCSGGPEGAAAVSDSAGVAIVDGPAVDSVLREVSFTEVARLSSLDGEEPLTDIAPWSLGVDSSNGVRVLLRQTFQVLVLDENLRPVRSVGRKGSGPGELLRPFYFAVDSDGSFAVHDFGRNAILQFEADGRLRNEYSLSGQMISDLGVNGDSLVFGTQVNYALPNNQSMDLVITYARDTTRMKGVEVAPAPSVNFPSCNLTIAYPPQFTKSLVWTSLRGRIAMSREVGYVVDVWEQGAMRSIRRSIKPRPGTAELAEALLGPGLPFAPNGTPCLVPAKEVVSRAGVAATIPVVRSIRFDRRGRIWVERWSAPGEDVLIDIFSSEGNYRGTIVGARMPVAFMSDDRAVYLEGNSRDGQSIVIKSVGRLPAEGR